MITYIARGIILLLDHALIVLCSLFVAGASGDPGQTSRPGIRVERPNMTIDSEVLEDSSIMGEVHDEDEWNRMDYRLNVFAETELNEYMAKKTNTMLFFVICVAFGNAGHIRTIAGLSQVANKANATKTDFGNMVDGKPTLLVLHGFCLLFMVRN